MLDVAESSSGKDCTVKANHRNIECLLVALQDDLEAVTDVALRALAIMIKALPSIADDYKLELRLTRRVWVAKHDICQDTKELAEEICQQGNFEVPIVMAANEGYHSSGTMHPEIRFFCISLNTCRGFIHHQ